MELIFNIVGMILVPCVLALFAWITSIGKSVTALELQVVRDYVSTNNLRELLAPLRNDVRNLERLMERVAEKLHVPAVDFEDRDR